MATVIPDIVRKATTSDIPQLSLTLGSAFMDDPVLSWCYPDARRRAELLPKGCRAVIEATLQCGGIDTVEGVVSGAIWIPPDAQFDEDALGAELVELAGADAERLSTLFGLMEEHHPHAEKHQYLWILGTRPEWQSRGLGSALMRPVLAQCDRVGMPAYLEATSERNVALYKRHGFEVTEVVTLPDGPPFWCMWRTPH